MDKVYIKSSPKEILIKGPQKEGHADIFSYEYYDDDNKRKLGSLFIIGHIAAKGVLGTGEAVIEDGEADEQMDASYMVNLVASLAKREYYSKPDLLPKDAFSLTLKKINGVIEEFFNNRGEAKINIGIFAVAGDNIHISKLGKFKILLKRNDQLIDVLNNITLFSKEHVEEKEFSNMLSGKINEGDKILAFYPGKQITLREKLVKDNFIKLDAEPFAAKLTEIKESKSNFACAAIYIDVNKVSEPAFPPKQELEPSVPVYQQETPTIIMANSDFSDPVNAVKADAPVPEVTKPVRPQVETAPDPMPVQKPIEHEELPSIIASEFSLGKKENKFANFLKSLNLWRSRGLGYVRPSPGRKNFKKYGIVAGILLVIIAVMPLLKISVVNPDLKNAKLLAKQAQDNLSLASEKISAQDLFGARQILTTTILQVQSAPEKVADTYGQVKEQLYKLLDTIDKAVEALPSLVDNLPTEVSAKSSLIANEEQKIKDGKYNLTSPVIDVDIYEDNLYVLATDSIYKVIDAPKGGTTVEEWLKPDAKLPQDPLHIAVDGNVYILNKSGVLTIYYKGAVQKTLNTYLVPDQPFQGNVMLTTKNSSNLYLVNKRLGRIYLITKEAGALIKTLKIGNSAPVVDAYLDNNEAIYLLTEDNRIWKLQ